MLESSASSFCIGIYFEQIGDWNMRQVVNGAKGRPLLGQSALSFNSSEEDDNFANALGESPTKSG